MDHYRITIVPETAFGTPVLGDTLFGHLCWAMRYREGSEALETFLNEQEQAPRILLSDGFIEAVLPRPVLTPVPRPGKVSRQEATEFKRRKKIRFLPKSSLEAIRDRISATAVDESLKEYRPESHTRDKIRVRVRINRFLDSVQEGGLFQRGETFYQPGIRLTVYAALHQFDLERFRNLLGDVALSGYGRDASVGMGAFNIEQIEPIPPLVRDVDTHLMTLSACVPSSNDPADVRYDLTTKYGKLGGLYACKYPDEAPIALKKPLIMLRPGATFSRENGSTFVGGMIRGTYPPNGKILHYAYALCWGFQMAGEKETWA